MWCGVYRIHQEGHHLARFRRTSSRRPLGWSSITRSPAIESKLLRTGSTTAVGIDSVIATGYMSRSDQAGDYGDSRTRAQRFAEAVNTAQAPDVPNVQLFIDVAHNQLRFGDAVELMSAPWPGNGEHGRQWHGENHGTAEPHGNDRPINPRPPVAGATTWIGASCPSRWRRSHLARRPGSHRAWRRREPGRAVP